MSKSYYIIPIFVPHEGCPHNCVFCNQDSITGSHNNVNYAYVCNTVEKYLSTIKDKTATIEISFFGGTFTAINIDKQKELLSAAKFYKDKGLIKYIRLSTRPDYINKTILDNLKAYSVDIIELGIQSLDEEVLIKSGRGHTVSDSINASMLIKEYNFTLGHQIMLGLPSDTFQKDIKTCKKSIELKPDICRIYPALVIKNTSMEKLFIDGYYRPYSLKEAVSICKIIYSLYIISKIKVIRIGLQPTEEINIGKEIVAGPFHAAFRELVESSLMNDMIEDAINKNYSGDIKLLVNSKDLSKLYANKKEYFNSLILIFKNCNFIVNTDDNLERGTIVLNHHNDEKTLLMLHYVAEKYNNI